MALATQPSPAADRTAADHAPGATSLLEPAALQRISRMELMASQVMDGYVQGLHRSPHVGFALDFAQHRPYVAGDDVRRIDWRVFAKADRYYIKQYEVSTNLRCQIVLDASASMAYRGPNDPLSKFRFAQFVAAALAYVVLHQQDAAGLVTFDSRVRAFVPARSTPSQLMRLLRTIDETPAERESGIGPILHEVAERIDRRGMVVVISDLFEDAGKLTEAVHHLRHKRHEVILLQVMSDDELTFPFRTWSEFENLEQAGDKMKLDPAQVRAGYLDAVAKHQKALTDGMAKLNVSHLLLNTSKPFDAALATYLARRAGRK
ncbi:MAG: hypothetical protein JWO31_2782 [Phycisphaerales bacterium]|nr:hypothetical protein [Phycisphaerales bacterium]